MKKRLMLPLLALIVNTAFAQNAYLLPVEKKPLFFGAGVAAELLTGYKPVPPQPFAVINGSGTLNYIPKFTPTGIDIGNSQIFDNGSNIGIATTTPGYKLDVWHGGINGMRVRSTAGLSALDVDAANGDAGVRFIRAGALQWQIGNNYLTNAFQINETGSGIRFFIQDATGNIGIGSIVPSTKLYVVGDISCTGAKAFTIDHPLDPENKMLRHFAIESNEVLNSYSGNIITNEKGMATVQLPDYFETINKDFRYQLTVIGSFARAIVKQEIKNNAFVIATDDPNVKVSWEVKALRNDKHMQQVNNLKAEEIKPAAMKGKYLEPAAYGLPESRGTNYSGTPKNPGEGMPPATENKPETAMAKPVQAGK